MGTKVPWVKLRLPWVKFRFWTIFRNEVFCLLIGVACARIMGSQLNIFYSIILGRRYLIFCVCIILSNLYFAKTVQQILEC